MSEPQTPAPQRTLVLTFIAALKILKGIALAGISLGLFRMAHSDLDVVAQNFIRFLKVSPENHFARLLMEKAGLIQPGTVTRAGVLTSVYSSILLLEGWGLWFGATWAEYLVVLSTGLFIPEEIISCFHAFNWAKLALLAANSLILGYFIHLVWKKHVAKAEKKSSAAV